MTFIDANHARQRAEQSRIYDIKMKYQNLLDFIDTSSSKGRMQIRWEQDLDSDCIAFLTEKGFTVILDGPGVYNIIW